MITMSVLTTLFGFYYLLGFLMVLAVVGLPVIFSGASLPLLFHQMRREVGHLGDVAGNLYSWNTVGSLLGALLGGYVLLFWIDLDQVYLVAVASLLAAALLLTIRIYRWHMATAVLVSLSTQSPRVMLFDQHVSVTTGSARLAAVKDAARVGELSRTRIADRKR